MSCKGFFPIISKPTYVAETSSTIIDHIITIDLTRRIFPLIIRTDLTDHYLTALAATKNTERTRTQPTKILRRDMSHFSSETFYTDVEQFVDHFFFFEDLTEITVDNFINVFDYFAYTYKRIVDRHAPLKCLSRKNNVFTTNPGLPKEF